MAGSVEAARLPKLGVARSPVLLQVLALGLIRRQLVLAEGIRVGPHAHYLLLMLIRKATQQAAVEVLGRHGGCGSQLQAHLVDVTGAPPQDLLMLHLKVLSQAAVQHVQGCLWAPPPRKVRVDHQAALQDTV